MTYKELMKELSNLTLEQLDKDMVAELVLSNETIPCHFDITAEENDLLDNDHPVIVVEI